MDIYSLESLAHFLDHARERYRHLPDLQAPGSFGGPDAGYGAQPNPARGVLWDQLAELCNCGESVAVTVNGWNRGGLLVRWEDLQGFVPTSQLADVPLFPEDGARDEILSRWVGKELTVKVIELEPARNRLVFSERASAWGPRQGEELLAQLSVGDVREGSVSNVCDFGAFVDLGGIDGLVHISEISWGRVTHPGTLLKIGDAVRVLVLSIDRENRHVGLSIKRLLPNPWDAFYDRYAVGDIVEAQVTHLADFGAFVQLERGLEGLVHISELADERIVHPAKVLSVGQRVRVRVLKVEKDQHRLSLSLKQANQPQGCDKGDTLSGSFWAGEGGAYGPC